MTTRCTITEHHQIWPCAGSYAGPSTVSRMVVDTLQITRPRRSQNPATATSWTPLRGLQIRAVWGAQSTHAERSPVAEATRAERRNCMPTTRWLWPTVRPGSASCSRRVSLEAEKIASLDRISTTTDRHDGDCEREGGGHHRPLRSRVRSQTSAVLTINSRYQHFRGAPGRTRTCGLPLRRLGAPVRGDPSSPLSCTDSAPRSAPCARIRVDRCSLGPA